MNKSSIKIVKTLPHLIPLFFPADVPLIFSESYSPEIYKTFFKTRIIKKTALKFGALKSLLGHLSQTSIKSQVDFTFVKNVQNKCEYTIKGDTVSMWLVGYDYPIKAEFFGENCEKLYFYDMETGKKIREIAQIIFADYMPDNPSDVESISINVPYGLTAASGPAKSSNFEKYIFVSSLNLQVPGNGIEQIETDLVYPPLFWGKLKLFSQEASNLKSNSYEIIIKSKNFEALEELNIHAGKQPKDNLRTDVPAIFKHFLKNLQSIDLPAGFISRAMKVAVFTDREIFGNIYLSKYKDNKNDIKSSSKINELLRQLEGSIQVNDFLVHEDYGIAKYTGFRQEEVEGVMLEYLVLKFAHDDELYVPLSQIEKITKYIGSDDSGPTLTSLGKRSWENIKKSVRLKTKLVARDLIEHYAKREMAKSKSISAEDSILYKEFEGLFAHTPTDDQVKAINEVIHDLEKNIPMNRLLVGDVGFGKTEVILRAAFKVAEDGGQVAVLAPTTVLAAQHYRVFRDRFEAFGVEVELLSRFNTTYQNKKIVQRLNDGKVDIVIGTHRLLSTDVLFNNLQLLVIDEEQRFGVKQKEKIKKLNYGTHVLYTTATPIPRTLGMALSSIQDISLITTPPADRKPVITKLIQASSFNGIVKALESELMRGGQVFFLHNRIESILSVKVKLERLLPSVKFVIAHGQMSSNELEKIMVDFVSGRYDVLVTTTIIENGLDLPNVNTIIINDAQNFGLSQLYQLRGRVGRSSAQAYCYLVYKGEGIRNKRPHKPSESKYLDRLQTLISNQELGSGFRISSKDLEMRGAGSFLGEKQHGNIDSVGYTLYIEMLAKEIENLEKLKRKLAERK